MRGWWTKIIILIILVVQVALVMGPVVAVVWMEVYLFPLFLTPPHTQGGGQGQECGRIRISSALFLLPFPFPNYPRHPHLEEDTYPPPPHHRFPLLVVLQVALLQLPCFLRIALDFNPYTALYPPLLLPNASVSGLAEDSNEVEEDSGGEREEGRGGEEEGGVMMKMGRIIIVVVVGILFYLLSLPLLLLRIIISHPTPLLDGCLGVEGVGKEKEAEEEEVVGMMPIVLIMVVAEIEMCLLPLLYADVYLRCWPSEVLMCLRRSHIVMCITTRIVSYLINDEGRRTLPLPPLHTHTPPTNHKRKKKKKRTEQKRIIIFFLGRGGGGGGGRLFLGFYFFLVVIYFFLNTNINTYLYFCE